MQNTQGARTLTAPCFVIRRLCMSSTSTVREEKVSPTRNNQTPAAAPAAQGDAPQEVVCLQAQLHQKLSELLGWILPETGCDTLQLLLSLKGSKRRATASTTAPAQHLDHALHWGTIYSTSSPSQPPANSPWMGQVAFDCTLNRI